MRVAEVLQGRLFTVRSACISRLKTSEVKVSNEHLGKGVGISLIRDYEYEGDNPETGSRCRVWIHRNLMHLFAGTSSIKCAHRPAARAAN